MTTVKRVNLYLDDELKDKLEWLSGYYKKEIGIVSDCMVFRIALHHLYEKKQSQNLDKVVDKLYPIISCSDARSASKPPNADSDR